MSDTSPVFSYRAGCYRKNGAPIDVLVELAELHAELDELRRRYLQRPDESYGAYVARQVKQEE